MNGSKFATGMQVHCTEKGDTVSSTESLKVLRGILTEDGGVIEKGQGRRCLPKPRKLVHDKGTAGTTNRK